MTLVTRLEDQTRLQTGATAATGRSGITRGEQVTPSLIRPQGMADLVDPSCVRGGGGSLGEKKGDRHKGCLMRRERPLPLLGSLSLTMAEPTDQSFHQVRY